MNFLYKDKDKNKLNHIGTQVLETDRLLMRKFMVSDASEMFNNWASDPEVSKYTLWIDNESISESKEFLKDWSLKYSSKQYYHWAIIFRENMQVIGSISVSDINNSFKSCYVGYTLGRNYWNKGIATEALRKVLDFMCNQVGMKKIYAFHDSRNIASGKVMLKCGMKFVKKKKKLFLCKTNSFIECDYYCYNPENIMYK